MKVSRRHFVGILYDCILFEHASLVSSDKNHVLALDDLADTFAFVADFYKHNRPLMDIPCDQFITRNQLHTVAGLVDYIEEMEHGAFEIFPGNVELREEAPSYASSSSIRRERRRQERIVGALGVDRVNRGSSKSKGGNAGGGGGERGWTMTSLDFYSRQSHDHHNDTDTDLDDEYSLVIPGLSKTDIQTFLWEYAYVPEDFQDDIATLIRYLRRDEWFMHGSKGSTITFDWGLEGVQKFSKDYNLKKVKKVELRGKEDAKRTKEAAQKRQEEWHRQQEMIREQEAARRLKLVDDFIWMMHKSVLIPSAESASIDDLIKTLEMEISEDFGFCFVALAAVGAFASMSFTHQSDLDLTLTGNIKHITLSGLVNALREHGYEGVKVEGDDGQRELSASLSSAGSAIPTAMISLLDPRTGIMCHLTLNEPIEIYRSKLVRTYALIEPRFGPIITALKQIAVRRYLASGSIYEDRRNNMPLGSYALALMLITFLQTENPPILPKLQQASVQDDNSNGVGEDDRPSLVKDVVLVQGIDCSFDRNWKSYEGYGVKNSKSAAELLVDFCRFFGYVFDYDSKEVNARVGTFRWRPDVSNSGSTAVGGLSGSLSALSLYSLTTSATSSTSELSGAASAGGAGAGGPTEGVTAVFHVMDPFVVGMNVTSACRGDVVRMVKECFQEAYEALIEGDVNLVFSSS